MMNYVNSYRDVDYDSFMLRGPENPLKLMMRAKGIRIKDMMRFLDLARPTVSRHVNLRTAVEANPPPEIILK